MTREHTRSLVEERFTRQFDADPTLLNAYLLIHSERHGIHWTMARGRTDGVPANPEQPYHTASIGKSFTGVIVAKLVEEGKVSFDDPIATYLPEALIKELHVYKGRDYSREITVGQLVSNTSGLPDYYEEKRRGSKSFLEMVLDEPARFWTPEETIEWSRTQLRPHFAPGKGCHYTNTGFNLLGLLIERVTSKPYHEALHDHIFTPLGMARSYLSHFSEPAARSPLPVASLNSLGRTINVEHYRSFSSIYASGQTVSTSEELLRFMKALVGGELVSSEMLERMQQWRRQWIGVDYGYGLMRLRPVPFARKYHAWGHLGSIGSFMLYNPTLDVYLVGNFNKTAYQMKTIRFVYQTMTSLAKFCR
jgi:CubicO group peptidase (beta-lactamase class C family)